MAAPDHVVSGELIESSWGNDVVDELARQETDHTAALNNEAGARIAGDQGVLARFPTTRVLYNEGSFTTPAATWGDYQIANFNLDGTYSLLVIVTGTLYAGSGGGECHIAASINGTIIPGSKSAKATILGGMNAFLVAQATTTLGVGSYTLSAGVFTSAAGNVEKLFGSVTTLHAY